MESVESWKPIFGLERYYQVSNLGRCRSFRNGCNGAIFPQYVNDRGFSMVDLDGAARKVYKLVGQCFLGKPPSPKHICIINIDGNRQNNRWDNLRWATGPEAMRQNAEILKGTYATPSMF